MSLPAALAVAGAPARDYPGHVMPDPQVAVACHGLAKSFGPVTAVATVDLEVRRGEIVALLGPSGCGKTTFLRLLAGLERPDAGRILLGGRDVAGNGVFVPAERRRIGLVFQDYALFPHLSVADNVGFGVRGDRQARAARVTEVLALVGLGGLAARSPHELSGGQQQRVALARALAPQPEIVLLDEPFSNLDADLRQRVRTEVREILQAAEATAVFVTHDQDEAFAISDRMAVMREGALEQVGRSEEIYHTPVTRFVADFVGSAEFVPAEIADGRLQSELGSFLLPDRTLAEGPAELMVRPEDIALTGDPTGDAEIVSHDFRGPVSMSLVRMPSGRMVAAAHTSQILFRPGERVRVAFRPDHLVVFRGERRVAWVPARARTGTGPA